MPGRRRMYYRKKSDKYSVEQTNVITPAIMNWTHIQAPNETQQDSLQFAVDVVPAVDFEGMRKVKHITVSFASTGNNSTPIFYAIVYIPQGYQSVPLAIPANGNGVDNYTANQFVMSSGVLEFDGGPLRIRSRLSRNLNSGDRIGLILATSASYETATQEIYMQINYAITLQ